MCGAVASHVARGKRPFRTPGAPLLSAGVRWPYATPAACAALRGSAPSSGDAVLLTRHRLASRRPGCAGRHGVASVGGHFGHGIFHQVRSCASLMLLAPLPPDTHMSQPGWNTRRLGPRCCALPPRARLTSRAALLRSLGGLPFFFLGRLSGLWAGVANALACGVMLAASFDLIHEARFCAAAKGPPCRSAADARAPPVRFRASRTEASRCCLVSCLGGPSSRSCKAS